MINLLEDRENTVGRVESPTAHPALVLAANTGPYDTLKGPLPTYVNYDLASSASCTTECAAALWVTTLLLFSLKNRMKRWLFKTHRLFYSELYFNTLKHSHLCRHLCHLTTQNSPPSSLLIPYITALGSFLTLSRAHCESLHIAPGCDDGPLRHTRASQAPVI